jgi:hypothetical protein
VVFGLLGGEQQQLGQFPGGQGAFAQELGHGLAEGLAHSSARE